MNPKAESFKLNIAKDKKALAKSKASVKNNLVKKTQYEKKTNNNNNDNRTNQNKQND